MSAPHVAAAWATIAGCVRIIGHVTPVPSRSCSVDVPIAPITLQTKGLLPCRSLHGWKWSEIIASSKPASSARTALRTRSSGVCSSDESQ